MGRLIFSTAAIILAGVIFFIFTQPTYDKVGQLKAQIAEYDQALEKAAQLATLRDTLLSRFNSFKPEDIDRLQKMLPDHVDNVRLILDMDELARSLGLSIQNVNISSSGDAKGEAIGAIGPDSRKFDSLKFSFSVNATYEKFLTFLQDLQSSLRLIDITSLTIAPAGNTLVAGAGATPQPLYNFTIEFKTYWLK